MALYFILMGISCFMLFANELLLAVYFICILDYGILWIIEKDSEIQKKASTSALLITPKPLTV